jgi:hypothetical protein
MVTTRGAIKRPRAPLLAVPLKPGCLSLEELERRLESSLAGAMAPASCECLGVLCQCDGQDCIAVCESHCLIDYF